LKIWMASFLYIAKNTLGKKGPIEKIKKKLLMKVHCTNCKTLYEIDAKKIPDRGTHVICRKCNSRFAVKKQSYETEIDRVYPNDIKIYTDFDKGTLISESKCKFCSEKLGSEDQIIEEIEPSEELIVDVDGDLSTISSINDQELDQFSETGPAIKMEKRYRSRYNKIIITAIILLLISIFSFGIYKYLMNPARRIKKIQHTVVKIFTFDSEGRGLKIGSGFFWNDQGHLITNYHVIDGAYKAEVKTYDGNFYPITSVLAENRENDLINVKVDISKQAIRWIEITENLPAIAERVIVIGNPLGFEQTVSDGIVSSIRSRNGGRKILQITAPISQGSSGSPVVNPKGQVIGVATLTLTEGQNLNFAIPSCDVIGLKTQGEGINLSAWWNIKYNGNEKSRKDRNNIRTEEYYNKELRKTMGLWILQKQLESRWRQIRDEQDDLTFEFDELYSLRNKISVQYYNRKLFELKKRERVWHKNWYKLTNETHAHNAKAAQNPNYIVEVPQRYTINNKPIRKWTDENGIKHFSNNY